MKNSEHLFFLIKSLSKAEKRSFKLFTRANVQGENNYTILFDAIDRMQSYDHGVLIKKLKGKVDSGSISTIKVQLSNLILKSLRHNNSINSPKAELRMYSDYLQILYEKGLYSQCKKLLNKVKGLARDYEEYLAIDSLSILEYQIAIKESNAENLKHYIDVTYPEVKQARATNEILAEFEVLSAKMRMLLLESTSVGGSLTEERFKSIIDDPLLKLDIDKYPLLCQVEYHTIWGHYHYTMNAQKQTYFHRKRVLELVEQGQFGERFWLTHARFLLVSLTTFKMFKAFDHELELITTRINNTPANRRSATFQAELNATLHNIRFHRDLDEGNFLRISDYIDELETRYHSSNHLMDTNLKMAFYFNLSYAYLGNENYKKGLFWVNELLNSSEMKNLREDIQAHARIVNICIHYRLENYELIPSNILSTQRFLKSKNRYNAILTSFLKFSNKYLTEPYHEKMHDGFLNEIEECKTLAIEDRDSQLTLDYIQLIAWLESIRTATSMESCMKLV